MHGKSPCFVNASPPAQTPQGQPCLTGVGNNPLTIKKPSQRTVSRMPKARRSRLSLTRCAGWATFPLCCPHLPRKKSNTSNPTTILPPKTQRRRTHKKSNGVAQFTCLKLQYFFNDFPDNPPHCRARPCASSSDLPMRLSRSAYPRAPLLQAPHFPRLSLALRPLSRPCRLSGSSCAP